eukprot:7301360-Prymnesium_polylepis.1
MELLQLGAGSAPSAGAEGVTVVSEEADFHACVRAVHGPCGAGAAPAPSSPQWWWFGGGGGGVWRWWSGGDA